MNDKGNIDFSSFDEYLRQSEPAAREKAANWQAAIGLQAVDGLKPSQYLVDVARRNISGEIGLDGVDELIRAYYQSKDGRRGDDDEEADRASVNINRVLSTRSFDFSAKGFISLHRRIFDGVFKFAGKVRDYDIAKREWVLRGESVSYLNYQDIRAAVDHDISREKEFDFNGLAMPEIVAHLARFVAGLWQIHPFGEGNTRTTAVFTIQYLRSIGFEVDNSLFAAHSWYFRNALVRANYKNVRAGVNYTYDFLEAFLRNLLMGENNELKNRHMVIDAPAGRLTSEAVARPTSGRVNHQAPIKLPSSTHQVDHQVDPAVKALLRAISTTPKSVKELMIAMKMKDRVNFMANRLSPALALGYVARLFPDNPRHPRQKYLLTDKGLAVINSL